VRQPVSLRRRGSLNDSTLQHAHPVILSETFFVSLRTYANPLARLVARNLHRSFASLRMTNDFQERYSRSLQFGPTPMSTCRGTAKVWTFSMCSRTRGCRASTSFSGTSKTSSS